MRRTPGRRYGPRRSRKKRRVGAGEGHGDGAPSVHFHHGRGPITARVQRPLQFDRTGAARYASTMTAHEIIQKIEALPPQEQVEIIRFACRLDAARQLTGPELTALAERMARTTDPSEALLLREAIARGFYGGPPHA